MGDTSRSESDSWSARLRHASASLSNPASLKGLILASAGGAVLLLPGLATAAVSAVVVIAFALVGVLDVAFAFGARRRVRRAGNRVWSLTRGLMSIAFAVLLGVAAFAFDAGAEIGLRLTVLLVGFYVVVRGLAFVIRATARRDSSHRGVRITGGITAVALGVLAVVSPETVTSAIISGAAVVALLLGLILITWGLRRDEGSAPVAADPDSDGMLAVLWDWIVGSDIGRERRIELADSLYYESPARLSKRSSWWVMLVLSVAIATYAVLADSTAVVIGAMLVAPLMMPILGLAGAIVNGWGRRAVDSAVMVGLGVTVSITLAYGLAAWAPVAVTFDTNTQIVSRTSPTILDMLIAIAAGAAGAFATVDKRVSSSIAGVAIAVALVPPLAVVGVALGGGRMDDAAGAFLLFLTNFVAIVLAACAVFVLTGFARPWALQSRASGILTTVIPFVALALVVMVPLMFTSRGLVATAAVDAQSQEIVEEWLGDDSPFTVESIDVTATEVTVSLVGAGNTPPAEQLQDGFYDSLFRRLAVTIRVTPVEVTHLPAPTPSAGLVEERD
ncbi:DUF389 domain-containing protein [Demequina sp. NBRC 110051]|uniref:DUF389 domain-containing protein n=1 Tax=Demequina sp. NBRC 110051 TaxID=1570340 RepID=UPI0013563E42|nr:DUF389 domain-containing protein [Demequina sp. NBRC 110051]